MTLSEMLDLVLARTWPDLDPRNYITLWAMNKDAEAYWMHPRIMGELIVMVITERAFGRRGIPREKDVQALQIKLTLREFGITPEKWAELKRRLEK